MVTMDLLTCQDGGHLQKVPHKNGRTYTILNLEDFLKDIEVAAKQYLNDLKSDPDLQTKAQQRARSLGTIVYIEPV